MIVKPGGEVTHLGHGRPKFKFLTQWQHSGSLCKAFRILRSWAFHHSMAYFLLAPFGSDFATPEIEIVLATCSEDLKDERKTPCFSFLHCTFTLRSEAIWPQMLFILFKIVSKWQRTLFFPSIPSTQSLSKLNYFLKSWALTNSTILSRTDTVYILYHAP